MDLQQIREKQFEKVKWSGYKPEDVDGFLGEVEGYIEGLAQKNHELEKKMAVLAAKLKDYREDEQALRKALVNAQKSADSIIDEAKGKAKEMVEEAAKKSSGFYVECDEIKAKKQAELEEIKQQVSQFKNNMLKLYKEHIQLLSGLPEHKAVETQEAKPTQEKKNLEEQPPAEIKEETPQEEESAPVEERVETAEGVDDKKQPLPGVKLKQSKFDFSNMQLEEDFTQA